MLLAAFHVLFLLSSHLRIPHHTALAPSPPVHPHLPIRSKPRLYLSSLDPLPSFDHIYIIGQMLLPSARPEKFGKCLPSHSRQPSKQHKPTILSSLFTIIHSTSTSSIYRRFVLHRSSSSFTLKHKKAIFGLYHPRLLPSVVNPITPAHPFTSLDPTLT